MGQSYALNKIHIYNYRANNRDKINEYHRKLRQKYRDYEKICKIFRNILF